MDDNIMKLLIFSVSLVTNIFSFILFFIDKKRAQKKKYRIAEKTLFLSAFALGGVGALFSMYLFRHKTKHVSFQLGIPIAAIITMVINIIIWM